MSEEHLTHQKFTVALPALTLSGDLALPYVPQALLVLIRPCAAPDPVDPPDTAAQVTALHDASFATLHIDLLAADECRFADAANHLPLLGERLLAVISELHRRIMLEMIPSLPIGLVAAGEMTPLAVRVAAQRDRDVRALVCHGGLIDLAGLQYLKVLQAPLLLFVDADDTAAIGNARRALPHITGVGKLELLTDRDAEARTRRLAALTVAWFRCHLAP